MPSAMAISACFQRCLRGIKSEQTATRNLITRATLSGHHLIHSLDQSSDSGTAISGHMKIPHIIKKFFVCAVERDYDMVWRYPRKSVNAQEINDSTTRGLLAPEVGKRVEDR